MLRLPALLGLCSCLLAMAAPVSAQTVYRCGADGRSYSQTPCPGGRTVDVDDSRTPEQQQEAQAAADRTARLGSALERERRMDEALAARRSNAPGSLGPSRDDGDPAPSRALEVVPHYSNQRPRVNRPTAPKFEAPAAMVPSRPQPSPAPSRPSRPPAGQP